MKGKYRVHRGWWNYPGGLEWHFGGVGHNSRVADFVHLFDVGHQVVLDGKGFLTNVTDFRLDVFMNADDVSLQVGGSDEGLFAAVARMPLESLVDLDHVPVQDIAEGKGSVALVTLELVRLVPLCHVLLQLPLVAERTGALVAVPLLHVLVDNQLVRTKLLCFEEASLANITVVSANALVNL